MSEREACTWGDREYPAEILYLQGRGSMELTVGEVIEGKVTGITKFGAFVQLPGGASGLVHISEIANAFVNDVNDFLSMGETVKVKILSITEAGKINLSIKQVLPVAPAGNSAARPPQARTSERPDYGRTGASTGRGGPPSGEVHGPSGDASFEDKLKRFMQESDSKMSGNKLYSDRRGNGRRRK